MAWKRARRSEQKEQRRRTILDAACALFEELGYDQATLNKIARKAGISKASLYTYFATREEIFLTLYEEAEVRFLNDMLDRLKQIRSENTAAEISRVWVEVALANETVLNLIPLLVTAMERNSCPDQIRSFSRNALSQLADLVRVLHGVDSQISEEQWAVFVRCAVSMMSGLWRFSEPAQSVRTALEHPDLDAQPWKFAPVMQHCLTALIIGLRSEEANAGRD